MDILIIQENLNGKKWNGKGFNKNNEIEYEIKDGNGNIKVYNYDNGELKFEGEYLNGKRNGKGKVYDDEGNLIFEGEYLNGERWNGAEKGYDCYSGIFEIRYLNGKIV